MYILGSITSFYRYMTGFNLDQSFFLHLLLLGLTHLWQKYKQDHVLVQPHVTCFLKICFLTETFHHLTR